MFMSIVLILLLIVNIYSNDITVFDSISEETQIQFSPVPQENQPLSIPDTLLALTNTNPLFELLISETGSIEEVTLLRSSGCATVDSLIISHLRESSFLPPKKDSETVAIKIRWEYKISTINRDILPQKQINNKDSLLEAEEIVVYGKKEREEYPQYTLSKSQIKLIPGYGGDAIKMLEILPSFSQTVSDLLFLSSALCIRGSNADDLRYFIDGIPLPKVTHFLGIQSIYNSDGLQSIDFFPGDFGVRYGGALSGVINLISDSVITDKLNGYGELSLLNGTAVLKSKIPTNGNLFFSVRRSWAGDIIPFFTADEEYWRLYFGDMNFKLSFHPHPKSKITLLLIGAIMLNRKKETHPVGITPWDSSYYHFVNPKDYPDTFFYLSAVHKYGSIDTIETLDFKLGYNFILPAIVTETILSKNIRNLLHLAITPSQSYSKNFDTVYSKTYYSTFFLRDEIRWNFNNIELLTGIEFNKLSLRRDILSGYDPARGGINPYSDSSSFSLVNPKNKGQINQFGFYLQTTINATKKLSFIPGLRIDYYPRLSYKGFLLPIFSPNQVYNLSTKYPLESSVRFNIRYQLNPHTSIYTSLGTFNKDMDPMYSYNIQPLRSVNYTAGIKWENEYLSFNLSSYFYRQWNIQEYIVNIGKNAIYVSGVRTDGKGISAGLEVYLTYQYNEKILAVLSYTLSRSLRWDFEESKYITYEKDRLHNLKLIFSYNLPYGIKLGSGLRLSSGIPKYPPVQIILYEDKGYFDYIHYRRGKGRLPPYFALDFKISQALWKERINWYIDIKNLNTIFYQSTELASMYFDNDKGEWSLEIENENNHRQMISPSLGIILKF